MKTRYSWLVVVFFLCGCSAVLNPYASEFNCPETEKGKCVAVKTAYDESLNPLVRHEPGAGESECRDCKGEKPIEKPPASGTGSPEAEYREALYKRMTGLLKEPETPMVAPPQVMRVLLLPYRGEGGELFMARYAYFFVERPQWILGDYLVEKGGE